jgi:acetyl-CoA carboxylase biotin carboxyl carrier protein
MELTNDDVQDILHALDGLPFGELSLETARFRLSLRRTGPGEWVRSLDVLLAPELAANAATADGMDEPASSGRAAAGPGLPDAPANVTEEGLTDVRAPLLGTFYRAPRPGAPPFVAVGSLVEAETVVCIIETMKLMNSVTAGVSGTVAEILLANAQFAEQGAVLMRIRAHR